MSKKKKILICLAAVTLLCFISIALLLFFNRNKVKNGFAIEILTGTTEFNNRVFHLQNGKFRKVDTWSVCYETGTPRKPENAVYEKVEGEPCANHQLDDYYIGEDFEAYLFNQIGGKLPTLVLFEDGKRVNIELPNFYEEYYEEYRALTCRDGKVYLIPKGHKQQGKDRLHYMCCIDVASREFEMVEYRAPAYNSAVMWLTQGLLLEDNSFLQAGSVIAEKKEVACVSKPDGTYRVIDVGDENVAVKGYFDTKDGFALVIATIEDISYEDFWTTIYYYDRDGNLLSKDEMDVSLINETVQSDYRFSDNSVCYLNNGKILLSVEAEKEERCYMFEYDLAKRKMKFVGDLPGWEEKTRMVYNRDGKTYTVNSESY